MAKKKKKIKLKPGFKYTLIIIILIVLAFSLFKLLVKDKWDAYESVNSNAKRISNEVCLLYYPSGFKQQEEALNKLCNLKDETEQVFDYKITKDGNYQYISYGDLTYFVDENFNYPRLEKIKEEKGKKILSDYLRYTMKKAGLDFAYSVAFLEDTYYSNIKDEDYTLEIKEDRLACYFKKYDTEVLIPIVDIGSYVGMEIKENKHYIKPSYIDPHRNTIAITFDDGPSLSGSSDKIYEALYKYDARGTFYTLGYRLNDNTKELLNKGISYGFEYGSHSMNHYDLTSLDKDEMIEEVMGVSDYFKNYLNYEIKTYRPPYGSYDDKVDQTITLPAVMWTIDSNDWDSHNPKAITQIINDNINDGDIILMHDIHDATAETVDNQNLIRDLVNQGYQIVTISELATHNQEKLTQGSHYGW